MLGTHVGTILGSHSDDVNPNLCLFQRHWGLFSTNVSPNTHGNTPIFCQKLFQKSPLHSPFSALRSTLTYLSFLRLRYVCGEVVFIIDMTTLNVGGGKVTQDPLYIVGIMI
jgi:hypothetical protein